jgi:hypothetical protein
MPEWRIASSKRLYAFQSAALLHSSKVIAKIQRLSGVAADP